MRGGPRIHAETVLTTVAALFAGQSLTKTGDALIRPPVGGPPGSSPDALRNTRKKHVKKHGGLHA